MPTTAHIMISDMIEKFFTDLENCQSVKGHRTVGQMRTICCLSYIRVIIKVVDMSFTNGIKAEEYLEFGQVLEVAEIMAQKALDEDCVLEDSHYENLLKRFREMKWLGIKKEKLNFKEK